MTAALVIVGLVLVVAIAFGSRSPTGTAPAAQGGTGPVAIAGPHPEYDNEISYALTQEGITDPVAWRRFKAQIAVESGFNPRARGDPDPTAPQYGPYPETAGFCSLGLCQVNRCAHPQYEYGIGWIADMVGGDLFEPNDCIIAAAGIWASCYRDNLADLDLTTRCYNGEGPGTAAYLARVQAVEARWG